MLAGARYSRESVWRATSVSRRPRRPGDQVPGTCRAPTSTARPGERQGRGICDRRRVCAMCSGQMWLGSGHLCTAPSWDGVLGHASCERAPAEFGTGEPVQDVRRGFVIWLPSSRVENAPHAIRYPTEPTNVPLVRCACRIATHRRGRLFPRLAAVARGAAPQRNGLSRVAVQGIHPGRG